MATDLHVAFWCNIDGRRYTPGEEVTVEDDDKAAMLIRDGLCRRADASAEPDGSPAPAEADGTSGRGGTAVKPDRSAPKPVWVDYAISQGMPETQARATSKTELVNKYDTPAEPEPEPGVEPGDADPQ